LDVIQPQAAPRRSPRLQLSMGPVKSKPDPPPREVVEEETSNGFHVFELHMPTMGANIILIVIIILAFASCWRLKLCKSLLRRRGSRRRSSCSYFAIRASAAAAAAARCNAACLLPLRRRPPLTTGVRPSPCWPRTSSGRWAPPRSPTRMSRAQGHQRAEPVRPAHRCSTTAAGSKRSVARKRPQEQKIRRSKPQEHSHFR
jgi:hypothetical protein